MSKTNSGSEDCDSAIQHSNDEWDETVSEMGLGRQASVVESAWDSEEELVQFLTNANKASDKDGIGGRTSAKITNWFEEEHPEAHRQKLENDEGICTEFTMEHGLEDPNEDEFHFAFICPRCGNTNALTGEPSDFGNRPFACMSCRWVSLLHADYINEFAEEAR